MNWGESDQAAVLSLGFNELQGGLVLAVEVVLVHYFLVEILLFLVIELLVVLLQLAPALDRAGQHLGESSRAEGEVFSADGQVLNKQRFTLTAVSQAALKSWGLKRS